MDILSVSDFYQKTRAPRSIVIYTSASCSACNKLKQWLATQTYDVPVFIFQVNQENLYSILDVSALPTLELYSYSQVKDTIEGFHLERIQRWIKN